MQFISFWPIDRTLSDASSPCQSGTESDGIKRVPPIPPKLQNYFNLAIILFSVISGHSLEEPYPSAEVQLGNSAAPVDWFIINFIISIQRNFQTSVTWCDFFYNSPNNTKSPQYSSRS